MDTEITPIEFEKTVQEILKTAADGLQSFETTHRDKIAGLDGTYDIDIVARFTALGAKFVVLIECKRHKNPIKREVVQILHDRMRSVGAHKAMLFSTSGFQSGAIEYATAHGIATVQVKDGKSCWHTRSSAPTPDPPPWANIPRYVGWQVSFTEENSECHRLISARDPDRLLDFLNE